MKVRIMTSRAIAYIKDNIKVLAHHYINREDPETWLKQELKEDAFVTTELFQDVPDFDLVLTKTGSENTDIQNIKTLYSNFKELNDSFATDERLWAGLSHTAFYNYVLDRYPIKESKPGDDILNHFFFKLGKPRCYMVNTLSRLWWLGRLLYAPKEDNPFKYLDFISHDLNGYAFTLYGSNWSNNKEVLDAFFDAIFEFEKDTNTQVKRELFNDGIKYVHCLTGKLIVDACDKDYIRTKVYEYLVSRSKTLAIQSEIDKQQNIKRTGIARLDKIIIALNDIGGMGDVRSIFTSFAAIDNSISDSDKDYIRENLKAYSPDAVSEAKGAIFFKTRIGDSYVWRVGVDYLTTNNLERRKNFINNRINLLNDFDKKLFNVINITKRDRISISEINSLKLYFGEEDDLNAKIERSLKVFRENAILEYLGKGEFKKAFKILNK